MQESLNAKRDLEQRERFLKRASTTKIKNWNQEENFVQYAELLRKFGQRVPKGFDQNKIAAKQGGKIAGDARKALEIKTGEKVVSTENYLPETKKVNKLKKGKDEKKG